MTIKSLLSGVICAGALFASQARAQTANDLGAGALSGYAMIKAFAGACKFEIEPPIAQVLDSNMKALMAKFAIPAGVPDQMIKEHSKQFIGFEKQSCVWGPGKFNAMVSQLAAEPLANAAKAGVQQAQIPPSRLPLSSFPPDPAPGAKDKAQAGIAGYLNILAIAKVCGVAADPTTTQAVVANINALQPASELSDKEIDGLMATVAGPIETAKAGLCKDGQAGFTSKLPELWAVAMQAAEGSGVALQPYSAPKAAASSAPVPATGLVTGSDAETIAAAIRASGEATLSKDKDGDPQIKAKSKGATWSVTFFGCKSGTNCGSMEFFYGIATTTKPTLARINEWNQKKRWSKAYIDSDGDPNINFDVNLRGGVSRANLDANIAVWVDIVEEFRAFFSK
jgi:hypothetical protein